MGKSIRDPIHGFIDVDDDALKVISSPFFQRLRHIHQTGFAYLVYPGMHHTRFEHSLGAMELTKDFCQWIKSKISLDFLTEDFIRLAGTIALLHDVGHMPFSHTFEDSIYLLKEQMGRSVEFLGKKTHVKYGVKLINEVFSKEIEAIGKKTHISDTVEFSSRVLQESPKSEEEKFVSVLISSSMDADRSDYLLRDSYYAGVGYGNFELDRIKRVLTYIDGKIAIEEKGVPAAEQFLLSRSYMFRTVYFHSVVAMYNSVASYAMAKLIDRGIIEVPTRISDFLSLDEHLIFSSLKYLGEKFVRPLVYRQGYKRYKRDVKGECARKISARRRELHQVLAQYDGDVLVSMLMDSPYYERENEGIYVNVEGKVAQLSQLSDLSLSLERETAKIVFSYNDGFEKGEKVIQDILDSYC